MSSNNPFHTDRKSVYLRDAATEADSTHPDIKPISLLCPISGDYMKNPVITPEGFVYDYDFILKSLKTKKEDPQSRSKLEVSDLTPLPELLPIIQKFIKRQTKFLEIKEQLIHDARAIAHQKPPVEKPALFMCPLSKTLIKNPVITAQGKIYDKKALKDFLISSGNKDEEGEPLSMEDVVNFDEFFEQIKVYNFYIKKQSPVITPAVSVNSSGYSFFGLSSLVSWIWPSEEENRNEYSL